MKGEVLSSLTLTHLTHFWRVELLLVGLHIVLSMQSPQAQQIHLCSKSLLTEVVRRFLLSVGQPQFDLVLYVWGQLLHLHKLSLRCQRSLIMCIM